MGRAGRPKLIQKEGHHFHDGYSRWHSIDQVHRPDLHLDIYKSIDNESIKTFLYYFLQYSHIFFEHLL